jgi:DNA-binding response OmpR family regulator
MPDAAQGPSQSCRVLIIEDHPSTLDLLGQVVEQAGYEPVLARGGNEGLRLLRQVGADAVLLDLMMEDMDGWTVLKTIKMDEALSSVPVIIVTARHQYQEEHWIESHEGLFEGYVLKPFLVDDLLDRLASVLK